MHQTTLFFFFFFFYCLIRFCGCFGLWLGFFFFFFFVLFFFFSFFFFSPPPPPRPPSAGGRPPAASSAARPLPPRFSGSLVWGPLSLSLSFPLVGSLTHVGVVDHGSADPTEALAPQGRVSLSFFFFLTKEVLDQ